MESCNVEVRPSKTARAFFTSDFHQLSHDWRTPLHSINGFAELLLMDRDLSPACADYVRAILSGSAELNDLVISHLDDAECDIPDSPILPERIAAKKSAYLSVATGSWTSSPPLQQSLRPESVVGPLGECLTLASLPPPETKRWIAQRKAELVAAVDGGLLTVDEVCQRYDIALEEFVSWQRGLERLGLRGLWQKRMQKDRNAFRRRTPPMCGTA